MAPRSHWRGYLKLSLVSCPISLYPAISAAERVSFRQVNRETGNRLRQQLVDTGTGEVVGSHQKGRGYEVSERQLLLIEEEDLERAQQEARRGPVRPAPDISVRIEEPEKGPPLPGRATQPNRSATGRQQGPADNPETQESSDEGPPSLPVRVENNRTIELERFVPGDQIDARFHDTPYYVVPRDEVGQEAFAVIRDAMSGKGVVGIGRIILSKRERPIMLSPMGRGLCGVTLRYSHDVRSEAEIFDRIPDLTLDDEMLEVAQHILETKTSKFDPAFLEDRYRTALVSMLRRKEAELPSPAAASGAPSANVVDLMEALKRSLETERPSIPPRARSRPRATSAKPPVRTARPGRKA